MKLCLKLLAIAVIAVSTYSLTGCSAPPTFSYQNVTIAITSYCDDCAAGAYLNGGNSYNPAYPSPPNPGSVILMAGNSSQGGTATFQATVTNAPQDHVMWALYPTPNLSDITTNPGGTSTPVGESSNPFGTINATSGNTITFTVARIGPFTGAALVQANQLGIPQGDLLLVASVADPASPSGYVTQNQLIQVYGTGSSTPSTQGPPSAYLTPQTGSVPAGQTQPVVTVARNASFAFYGGIIGAAGCLGTACVDANNNTLLPGTPDNSAIWGVCPATTAACTFGTAIIGGNSSLGKITQQGVYTAPAAIPTTANSTSTINNEVQVIVYSHTANSVAAYAYVGIN